MRNRPEDEGGASSTSSAGTSSLVEVSHARRIEDGDALHNMNCYDYLKQIVGAIDTVLAGHPALNKVLDWQASDPDRALLQPIPDLYMIFKRQPDYDPNLSYGALYTEFLLVLEDRLSVMVPAWRKYQEAQAGSREATMVILVDTCLEAIYCNPNLALERAAEMVGEELKRHHHTSSDIEKVIRNRLKLKGEKEAVNTHSPVTAGSAFGLLWSNLPLVDYKPQTLTSLPSVRRYDYLLKNKFPREYRLGTQAEVHDGDVRVSPLFEAWLEMQAKNNPEKAITHIYFNYLAMDRPDSNYQDSREKGFTDILQGLEKQHSNVAVITLPADKGLFDIKLTEQEEQTVKLSHAYQRILAIVTSVADERDDAGIYDFFISDKVKMALYPDKTGKFSAEKEAIALKGLLNQAMVDLGFNPNKDGQLISPADMQAIYFHFIKFRLTDFIIQQLKPLGFNMSCKDGIDRGGVSSAYYNLMKSIEHLSPLTEDEFFRALHAAPTLVKGRGMNKHTKLIWNALNAYVRAAEAPPPWLVKWVKENDPQKMSPEYFIKMIESYILERQEKPEHKSFMGISGGIDKTTKLGAARQLITLLNNPDDMSSVSAAYHDAMKEGQLGKIYNEIVKKGLLDEGEMAKALSQSASKVGRRSD